MRLLTQNSDLKKTGIYGWTLPTHWVTLSNGESSIRARTQEYVLHFVMRKVEHSCSKMFRKSPYRKTQLVLYKTKEWIEMMNNELAKAKYDKKYIRLHDSGDFFSVDYALAWFKIMNSNPQCIFLCLYKEVEMFKYTLADQIPKNFILIYSFGGKQDHMIDKREIRTDVYTDYERMITEGYFDIRER